MGVMRFRVHDPGLLSSGTDLGQAYVSGFDGRVFPSRLEVQDDILSFRRMNSESGKLHIAFPVPGFGRPVLSTATLREQEEAYDLALELARGKICQVRNQLAAWESLGMSVPPEFRTAHREAHQFFARATTAGADGSVSGDLSLQAIERACQAADLLTRAYVAQRLAVRLRRTPQLPVSFGCGVNCSESVSKLGDQFLHVFNAASIPVEWKQIETQEGEYNWSQPDALIEWCHERRVVMRGGPLLDLSANGLPAWLQQWGHDFFNLQSFLCDFVETAISRYLGKVRIWEVSSRVNTGGAFNLNEEERLTLVARTLEVARKVDEESQLFIRVEEPWGSYQSQGQHKLSPIQFVDSLLRCGIGLTGVDLELAVGFDDRGFGPRDLLDCSRLLDQWSMLEVPLHVTLAFPTSQAADPHSTSGLRVSRNGWRDSFSPESQADWIDLYVPLLMAKQSVVGIYWNHLTDAATHTFPNAGLMDVSGSAKIGLDAFLRHKSGRTLA